jgi:nicotinamidase-related amidase
VDSDHTALLVMDVQDGVVDRLGDPAMMDRVVAAVTAAREAGVRVIHVKVGFRPGYPEAHARNKSFSRISESGQFIEGESSQVHAQVAPRPEETIVTKKRVSAFSGSDLDMVLRAGEITSLVLTGIATSGVVLSTLRQAADLDFELTVLADACADQDEEVHRVLTEKVFPRQATVTTVSEWSASLPGAN